MGMDEMTCVCGEVLRGEKGKGQLYEQYTKHLSKPDHNPSPAAWAEAYKKIEAGKERQKKQHST